MVHRLLLSTAAIPLFQVALRRQQAQEEAEAKEMGIGLLRPASDLADNEKGIDVDYSR